MHVIQAAHWQTWHANDDVGFAGAASSQSHANAAGGSAAIMPPPPAPARPPMKPAPAPAPPRPPACASPQQPHAVDLGVQAEADAAAAPAHAVPADAYAVRERSRSRHQRRPSRVKPPCDHAALVPWLWAACAQRRLWQAWDHVAFWRKRLGMQSDSSGLSETDRDGDAHTFNQACSSNLIGLQTPTATLLAVSFQIHPWSPVSAIGLAVT